MFAWRIGFGSVARARDLGEPTARVLELPQRNQARPIAAEVRAANPVDHVVVGLDRLAGVAPVALEHVVLERALAHVVVVDVGDLELAASGRLEPLRRRRTRRAGSSRGR